MWIRSQNKKRLVNVGMLDICDTRIFVSELPGQIPKSGICVGKYESEERAIEVLDEIIKNMLSPFYRRMGEKSNRRGYDKQFLYILCNSIIYVKNMYHFYRKISRR